MIHKRVFAHDPGSVNYGYCVLEFRGQSGERKEELEGVAFSIRKLGKIQSIVTTLKDARAAETELIALSGELNAIIREMRPDVMIAERYMSRRMGGVTIELVNMTIGVLRHVGMQRGLPTKLVPASQWKNELKRREVDLKLVYKEAKRYGVSAHEVDATMIALYGMFTLLKYKAFNVEDIHLFVDVVLQKIATYKETKG